MTPNIWMVMCIWVYARVWGEKSWSVSWSFLSVYPEEWIHPGDLSFRIFFPRIFWRWLKAFFPLQSTLWGPRLDRSCLAAAPWSRLVTSQVGTGCCRSCKYSQSGALSITVCLPLHIGLGCFQICALNCVMNGGEIVPVTPEWHIYLKNLHRYLILNTPFGKQFFYFIHFNECV